jgi:hypothetical protein
MSFGETIELVLVNRADSSAASDGLEHLGRCVGAGDVDDSVSRGPDGHMNALSGGIVDRYQRPPGARIEC